MAFKHWLISFMMILMGLAAGMPAHAKEGLGLARDWQLGFQEAVTPVMERLVHLHNMLLIIITLIVIFVFALLAVVCLRFNHRANPTPSKVTHNTLLEIIWTTIPILILVAISIPSLKELYYMDRAEQADMTLKIVGHQWYWEYEYPDQGIAAFDSRMKADKELQPGEPRLLAVDSPVVVPVDTTVRVLVTAADVIHSWAMPSFGIKTDAVPGTLNETWFKVTKTGTYYGQCSELCGVDHSFMPIMVKVVTKKQFDAWVAEKKRSAATDMRIGLLQQ